MRPMLFRVVELDDFCSEFLSTLLYDGVDFIRSR